MALPSSVPALALPVSALPRCALASPLLPPRHPWSAVSEGSAAARGNGWPRRNLFRTSQRSRCCDWPRRHSRAPSKWSGREKKFGALPLMVVLASSGLHWHNLNSMKINLPFLLVFGLFAPLAGRADLADKHLDIYWMDVEGGAATLIVTPEHESV